MIMPRKETCSICGKEFMDGCLVQCPPICDECHGVPSRIDPNKINTQEEYLKAIKAANEKRYGSTADVIERMLAIASEEPLTPEEADQELRDAGVDVDAFAARLLEKVRQNGK